MSAVCITVPVHEESGWTTGKKGGKVPLRVAAPKAEKTLEELHKAEKNAEALHKIHLESVAAHASRETQRAAEAKARRLRLEANARHRVEEKMQTVSQREHRLVEEKARLASERKEAREALAEAVKAARAARQAAVDQRGAAEAGKCASASGARSKHIQATVDKNAFAVKKALAVAAAVKAGQAEAAAHASDKLAARLGAAQCRREEKENERATQVDRSAQVARHRNAQQASLAEKRLAIEQAIEGATQRRADALRAVVEVAAKSKLASPPPSPPASARRAELFQKLNAAEVRRLALRRSSQPPVLIEVPLDKGAYPAGSEALLERLSTKVPPAGFGLGCLSVQRIEHALGMTPIPADACRPSPAERHEHAAQLHTMALAARRAMGALFGRARPMAAAIKRAELSVQRRVALDSKALASAEALYFARAARVRSARIMNLRVAQAASARAAQHAELKSAHRRAELYREVCAGRRAEKLLHTSAVNYEKHTLAAARRAIFRVAQVVNAELLDTKMELAGATRAHVLSSVVARAKMSSVPRSAPVKLTHNGEEVSVVEAK